MKKRNIFKFALDSMLFRIGITLFIIAMNVVALVLIDISFREGYKTYYKSISLNEVSRGKQEEVIIVDIKTLNQLSEEWSNRVEEVYKGIKNLPGVKALGCSSNTCITFAPGSVSKEYENYLIEKNAKRDELIFGPDSASEVAGQDAIRISKGLLNAGNLKLSKGSFDCDDKDCIPVVIGYELTKYLNVGDILTDRRELKYKVVGVFEKDQKWYSNDDIFSEENYYSDLNDLFMVLDDSYKENLQYMVHCESKDVENLKQGILRVGNDKGISLTADSLKVKLKNFTQKLYEENKNLTKMVIFFMLIAFIGMSSASSVAVILNKRNYGIMTAIGFEKKDIASVIFVDNFIKIFVAAIIAYVYCDCMLNNAMVLALFDGQVVLDMHRSLYIWLDVVIVVVVSVLASILPIRLLYKQNVVELVGGKE